MPRGCAIELTTHHSGVDDGRISSSPVFTRRRIAVFLDGCFWHGCPEHATLLRTNSDYWLPKLQRNVERDRSTDALLCDAGWTVLRYWDHDTLADVAQAIAEAVRTFILG